MSPPRSTDNLLADAEGFAVLVERVGNMTASLEEVKRSIAHMATKEQVDRLVGRHEFEKTNWEVAQLRKDMEEAAKALREEIERSSLKKAWGNLTSIAGGLAGLIALVATVWGGKHP